jgi:hypothetical protein
MGPDDRRVASKELPSLVPYFAPLIAEYLKEKQAQDEKKWLGKRYIRREPVRRDRWSDE